MAHEGFIRYLLLPELRLLETRKGVAGGTEFFVEKTSGMEVCPRCATPSTSTYDGRWVKLKDDPLRNGEAILWVHKRRLQDVPASLHRAGRWRAQGLPHDAALPQSLAVGVQALQ